MFLKVKKDNSIFYRVVAVVAAALVSFSSVFLSYQVACAESGSAVVGTGKAFNAKNVLTMALAAGGLIAGGAWSGSVTPAQKVEIRNKVGALEDAYLAQEYAKTNSSIKMATYVQDGVKKYYPIVAGAVVSGASSAAKSVTYVSQQFLSGWYTFLNDHNFLGVSDGSISVGSYNVSNSGEYVAPSFDSSLHRYTYPNANIYINGKLRIGSYTDPSYTCSQPAGYIITEYSSTQMSAVLQPSGVQGLWLKSDGMSIETAIPVFFSYDSYRSYVSKYNGSAPVSVGNASNIARSYGFGLTNNLPVGTQDVFWPKTWAGNIAPDLPVSGVGTIPNAPDIPGIELPYIGSDVIGQAVPIDLGPDIPGIFVDGSDVPAGVIEGVDTGTGTVAIPGEGELPWVIPGEGTLPFPIPGVSYPGVIPSEIDWPTIQEKAQEGEGTGEGAGEGEGEKDTPDVRVIGLPTTLDHPDEHELEDASKKFFDWSFDKLKLPDGIWDKIPFSIPYDFYLLATSMLGSGGGSSGAKRRVVMRVGSNGGLSWAPSNPQTISIDGDLSGIDVTTNDNWNAAHPAPILDININIPYSNSKGQKENFIYKNNIDLSEYNWAAKLVYISAACGWLATIAVIVKNAFDKL